MEYNNSWRDASCSALVSPFLGLQDLCTSQKVSFPLCSLQREILIASSLASCSSRCNDCLVQYFLVRFLSEVNITKATLTIKKGCRIHYRCRHITWLPIPQRQQIMASSCLGSNDICHYDRGLCLGYTRKSKMALCS